MDNGIILIKNFKKTLAIFHSRVYNTVDNLSRKGSVTHGR